MPGLDFSIPALALRQGARGRGLGSLGLRAWYDPSDLPTLFQDSAMSIPVAADGDPVGAMRDKSGNGFHMLQDTASKCPLFRSAGGLSWLEFDGVDDAMAVASLSLAGSDEITLAAAVHTRRNDLAGGILCELSALSSSTPGTFSLVDPVAGGTRTGWRSRGSLNTLNEVAWTADPPPVSVFACMGKISTDLSTLRRNGVEVISATSDQGSGSFATAPLYLGARAGLNYPYQGRLYGLCLANRVLAPGEIARLEAFLAARAGAAL